MDTFPKKHSLESMEGELETLPQKIEVFPFEREEAVKVAIEEGSGKARLEHLRSDLTKGLPPDRVPSEEVEREQVERLKEDVKIYMNMFLKASGHFEARGLIKNDLNNAVRRLASRIGESEANQFKEEVRRRFEARLGKGKVGLLDRLRNFFL